MKKTPTNLSGHKAKNFKGTLKTLIKRLWGCKATILISLIFAALSSLLIVCGPYVLNKLMTYIIDSAKLGLAPETAEILKWGFIVLGMYLLAITFQYFEGILTSKAAIKVSKSLRSDIFKKINKLPLRYFDKHSYGDVLSRVTNDVDTVGQTLDRTLASIVSAVVTIIGIPVIMFIMNWQLTLISLAQIPLSLIVVLVIVKRNQKHFVKQQKYLGDINGYVEEHYSAHSVIKAFNGEEKAQQEFELINQKLRKSSQKAQFYSNLMHPIMNFISNAILMFALMIFW